MVMKIHSVDRILLFDSPPMNAENFCFSRLSLKFWTCLCSNYVKAVVIFLLAASASFSS